MRTAEQIIVDLGNTTAVATAIGLTPSTVQSWKEANFIPEWRRDALIALAKSMSIRLAPADFPTVEQRRSRTDRPTEQPIEAAVA